MANTTIDQLASLAGADVANTDLLLIYDGSAVIEKQLSIADLRTAVYAAGPNIGSGTFTITSTGTSDALIVTSTDALATAAPDIVFYRNSASPAASDFIGKIEFRGKNSGAVDKEYASINTQIISPTSSAETGAITFNTMNAGTSAERVRINNLGTLSIGSAGAVGDTLRINRNITGGTTSFGIRIDGAIQSDVTTATYMNRTNPTVVNSAFTLANMFHYAAAQSTIGASATVTNQVGFLAEASLIGATNNSGFQMNGVPVASITAGKTVYAYRSSQAIATGGGTAYNLYMEGTAPNYFAGLVGIGTNAPAAQLHVLGNTTSIATITTASITGTTLNVVSVVANTIAVGDRVYGAGVSPITRIVSQIDGTPGGAGNYTVSVSKDVPSGLMYTSSGTSATVRITDTDTTVQAGQPSGTIEFFGSDANTPTAGVGAYISAISEDSSPDTALTFGTRAAGGGGVDANERMRIDSAGNVGIGTAAPNAAAKLQVDSTTQGFLPPRMTTTQRNAIATPPAGLMIYNTTTNKLNFYNGTAWEAVTSA